MLAPAQVGAETILEKHVRKFPSAPPPDPGHYSRSHPKEPGARLKVIECCGVPVMFSAGEGR
jgi:hypothetical protein